MSLAALCGRPRKWQALFALLNACCVNDERRQSPSEPLAVGRLELFDVTAEIQAVALFCRGLGTGCPATPETVQAGSPVFEPRQPIVAVDCADQQGGGIGQPPAAFVGVLRG
jgi:hypothetical protein